MKMWMYFMCAAFALSPTFARPSDCCMHDELLVNGSCDYWNAVSVKFECRHDYINYTSNQYTINYTDDSITIHGNYVLPSFRYCLAETNDHEIIALTCPGMGVIAKTLVKLAGILFRAIIINLLLALLLMYMFVPNFENLLNIPIILMLITLAFGSTEFMFWDPVVECRATFYKALECSVYLWMTVLGVELVRVAWGSRSRQKGMLIIAYMAYAWLLPATLAIEQGGLRDFFNFTKKCFHGGTSENMQLEIVSIIYLLMSTIVTITAIFPLKIKERFEGASAMTIFIKWRTCFLLHLIMLVHTFLVVSLKNYADMIQCLYFIRVFFVCLVLFVRDDVPLFVYQHWDTVCADPKDTDQCELNPSVTVTVGDECKIIKIEYENPEISE